MRKLLGYKKDDAVLRAFPNMLMQRIQDFAQNANGSVGVQVPGQAASIGELTTGAYVQERIPSFSQGSLVQTNGPLDLAIEDQGIPYQNINGRLVKPAAFFAVQLANGEVGYTRNGKLDVDANGQLVTPDGYRVLGATRQPIQLPAGVSKEDLSIDTAGNIIAYPNDPARSTNIGQIGIAVVQNPNELVRNGENVYTATNQIPLVGNPTVSLHQGYIEQSNVDTGQTMTDMMVTVRNYEANQKVINAYDQTLQQLNSIGKING